MSAINTFLPLQLFESGQLLRIPPTCQGGLILQQAHHAEFVGVGSGVGSSFDVRCRSVYTLGRVQLDVPATYVERRQSYRRRIAYMERQHKITAIAVPLQRAYIMIRQLCLWLPVGQVRSIPDELMGLMVGVFPKTVVMAWTQYLYDHPETRAVVPTSCQLEGATCQVSDRHQLVTLTAL